jgi:hypothetical protein
MRNQCWDALHSYSRLLLTVAGTAAVSMPIVMILMTGPRLGAQATAAQSAGAAGDRPAFDAVSIRVNNNAGVGVGRINLTQSGGHLTRRKRKATQR